MGNESSMFLDCTPKPPARNRNTQSNFTAPVYHPADKSRSNSGVRGVPSAGSWKSSQQQEQGFTRTQSGPAAFANGAGAFAPTILQNESAVGKRINAPHTIEMHKASQLGDVNALERILSCGYSVDSSKDLHGNTPLHTASACGQAQACKFLLSRGARPNYLNVSGETPLDLARKFGFADCAKLLEDSQADLPAHLQQSSTRNPSHRPALIYLPRSQSAGSTMTPPDQEESSDTAGRSFKPAANVYQREAGSSAETAATGVDMLHQSSSNGQKRTGIKAPVVLNVVRVSAKRDGGDAGGVEGTYGGKRNPDGSDIRLPGHMYNVPLSAKDSPPPGRTEADSAGGMWRGDSDEELQTSRSGESMLSGRATREPTPIQSPVQAKVPADVVGRRMLSLNR